MRFFSSFKEAFFRLLITGSVLWGATAVVSLAGFMTNTPLVNKTAMDIMPYTVLPVLIIIAFSFLMKRSSVDVFHALPVKRQTVFISNLLVCVLWTALCYLTAIGISSLCFKGYNIDLFTHLCTFVFVLGASSLGTVLTGRIFSSIVNTLIIALVPKLLYNTVLGSIFSRLPFVIFDAPGTAKYSYTSFLPVKEERLLYLIAGAVLTVLAFILFLLRKSETAGKSAPNRFLRIFHSGIIAFSVSCIAIYLVSKGESMGTVILVYGISVIVPFLYEFLSTRRLEGLKYGFIAIIIMAVLNVGVYAFMETTVARVQNERIEIKGYQIINKQFTGEALAGRDRTDIFAWADWEKSYNQYGYLKTLDHFITDEEYCKLFSQCYDESKTIYEEYKGMLPYAQEQLYLTGGYARFKAALLDEEGKRYYRYVYLTHDQVKTLTDEALSKDEEFLEKSSILPEIEKVKKVTCTGDSEFDKKLYQCYYEEMMKSSSEKRIFNTYTVYGQCKEYMYNSKYGAEREYVPDHLTIRVEGNENNKDFYGYYYISSYIHPQAYEMIRAYRQPIDAETARKLLTGDKSDYTSFTVELICLPDRTVYPNLEEIRTEALTVKKKDSDYRVSVSNENISDLPYHISQGDYYNVYDKYYETDGVFGNAEPIEDLFVRLSDFVKTNRAELKDTTGHLILSYKADGQRYESIDIRLDFTYDEYKAFVESIGGRVNYD